MRPTREPPRSRSGFTLFELLIAMTLVLVLLGIGAQFFRRQANLLAAQAGRMEAQQTSQFGIATLERELRVAGVGVVDVQPLLVQADRLALTFNADLVSRTTGDVGSVYVDPDAAPAAVGVLATSNAIALPIDGAVYPDSTYMKSAGVPSGAETISFWLSPDSTTRYPDEYSLFRRVNAMEPQLVARGVRVTATDTVFQYFKADTSGFLVPIPPASLPLYHEAPVHGSVADTGRFAIIDSIKAVRVRLTVVHHDPRSGDARRRLEMTIRLANAGLINRTTCGDPPIGVAVTAQPSAVDSLPSVTITWDRSLDEGEGEKDVERYLVFRRPLGSLAFAEPFATIPAGLTTYSFVDTDVRSGETWVYGVASQDCTPNTSDIGVSSFVTLP